MTFTREFTSFFLLQSIYLCHYISSHLFGSGQCSSRTVKIRTGKMATCWLPRCQGHYLKWLNPGVYICIYNCAFLNFMFIFLYWHGPIWERVAGPRMKTAQWRRGLCIYPVILFYHLGICLRRACLSRAMRPDPPYPAVAPPFIVNT